MKAVHFTEANKTFPKDGNDISAYMGKDPKGNPFINTIWMPNKQDIEAINAGHPIILSISGNFMPPIELFTCDENGNINE